VLSKNEEKQDNYTKGTVGNKTTTQNVAPTYNDDYVSCNTCGRRYNDNAYTKHLPTCQQKAKVNAIKGKGKNTTTTNNNTGNGPFLNKTNNNNSNKKY
jgi:hypothetical protein